MCVCANASMGVRNTWKSPTTNDTNNQSNLQPTQIIPLHTCMRTQYRMNVQMTNIYGGHSQHAEQCMLSPAGTLTHKLRFAASSVLHFLLLPLSAILHHCHCRSRLLQNHIKFVLSLDLLSCNQTTYTGTGATSLPTNP